jgi:hypothetical protein
VGGRETSQLTTYKDSSILVHRVEDRNRASFSVDRVDLWRLPESSDPETHGEYVKKYRQEVELSVLESCLSSGREWRWSAG